MELSEEQKQQVKALFREAFKIAYEQEKFMTVVNSIKEGADAVPLVTELVVAVMSAIIKQTNLQDPMVLMTVASAFIGDLAESLEQAGLGLEGKQVGDIISMSITGVLERNPEFAQSIFQNPKVQELMQQAKGGQPQQQGVL